MMKTFLIKFFKPVNPLFSIKQELDILFQDKKLKVSIRFMLGFLFLTSTLVLLLWRRLPPKIPLFYSRPWGEEQLVERFWLLVLPIICFLLISFNFRLAGLFLKKENLLAQILIWSSLILVFLLSTTIIRILLIVV